MKMGIREFGKKIKCWYPVAFKNKYIHIKYGFIKVLCLYLKKGGDLNDTYKKDNNRRIDFSFDPLHD